MATQYLFLYISRVISTTDDGGDTEQVLQGLVYNFSSLIHKETTHLCIYHTCLEIDEIKNSTNELIIPKV